MIAIERCMLQHLSPQLDLRPDTSLMVHRSAHLYERDSLKLFGTSRLRFSKKLLKGALPSSTNGRERVCV